LRSEQFEITQRTTDGNPAMLSPLGADLVARKVDLICAQSSTAVRAARALTDRIPIVAIDLETNPIDEGFVASHALDFPDFSKKWLEVLKEAVPQLTAVAVLWDPAVGPYQVTSIKTAAQSLGFTLALVEVRQPSELQSAFESIVQKGAGAVVTLASTVAGSAPKLLADLALDTGCRPSRRSPSLRGMAD
jgi:putative ABC transport system substrate-binding protein